MAKLSKDHSGIEVECDSKEANVIVLRVCMLRDEKILSQQKERIESGVGGSSGGS